MNIQTTTDEIELPGQVQGKKKFCILKKVT